MVMLISFLLQQQDQEEAADEEVEMVRNPVLDLSPPSSPPPASVTAPTDTPDPSYTTQHSPEYSCQFEGARKCYGCFMFIGFHTGIDGPEVDSS